MSLKTDCELKLPKDKEIIDTPIAYFWFDEQSILYSIAKPGERNLEMIKNSFKILKSKVGNEKICLISDTSKTSYYTIEMREELAKELASIIKAIALVPCTPTGKLIANILFMRETGFPARVFSKLKDAQEWIRQYC